MALSISPKADGTVDMLLDGVVIATFNSDGLLAGNVALEDHKTSGDHDARYMRTDAQGVNNTGSIRVQNWASDPAQGVVYLGNGGKYLTWNGVEFSFGGGHVAVGNAKYQDNGDVYMPWANNYLSSVLAGKQPTGNYLVAGTRASFSSASTPSLGAATAGSLGAFEVFNGDNTNAASVIAFHRGGQYATYFGLDTDNQFRWGGWSAGANSYLFWTSANFNPGTKADMGAGCQWNSGIVEFGDASFYDGIGADVPAPYVLIGVRPFVLGGKQYLKLRGVAMRNN